MTIKELEKRVEALEQEKQEEAIEKCKRHDHRVNVWYTIGIFAFEVFLLTLFIVGVVGVPLGWFTTVSAGIAVAIIFGIIFLVISFTFIYCSMVTDAENQDELQDKIYELTTENVMLEQQLKLKKLDKTESKLKEKIAKIEKKKKGE